MGVSEHFKGFYLGFVAGAIVFGQGWLFHYHTYKKVPDQPNQSFKEKERIEAKLRAFSWADKNGNKILEANELIDFRNELEIGGIREVLTLNELEYLLQNGISLDTFNRYNAKKVEEIRKKHP